jgi:hypothetical protein
MPTELIPFTLFSTDARNVSDASVMLRISSRWPREQGLEGVLVAVLDHPEISDRVKLGMIP